MSSVTGGAPLGFLILTRASAKMRRPVGFLSNLTDHIAAAQFEKTALLLRLQGMGAIN